MPASQYSLPLESGHPFKEFMKEIRESKKVENLMNYKKIKGNGRKFEGSRSELIVLFIFILL